MLDRHEEEQNFIEKKRQWKGDLDKPLRRGMLIMILPALIIGVFLIMSAPYLRIIAQKIMDRGPELDLKVLNLKDAPKGKEEVLPPPNPELQIAQYYRDLYDKEGFDWRSKPVAPEQDMELAKEQPIKIAPLDVEMPATQEELRRLSKPEAAN